jgi:hypothetical protein
VSVMSMGVGLSLKGWACRRVKELTIKVIATIQYYSADPSDINRHSIHMLYISNDQDYQSNPRGADRARLLAMAAALIVISIAVQATVLDRHPQPASAIL